MSENAKQVTSKPPVETKDDENVDDLWKVRPLEEKESQGQVVVEVPLEEEDIVDV